MDAIELIRLKVQVLEVIEGALLMSCKALVPKIKDALLKSPEFLGGDHMSKFVGMLAREDRLAALTFAKELLQRDHGSRLEDVDCRLLHVLLYPTIFDDQAAKAIVYQEAVSPHSLPGSRGGSPVKKQLSKAFDDASRYSLGMPPPPATLSTSH